MIDANGRVGVNLAQDAVPMTFALDVSLESGSSISKNGGQILTFTGRGLPLNTDELSITFSDGTSCHVESTSLTRATCRTQRFNAQPGENLTYTVIVTTAAGGQVSSDNPANGSRRLSSGLTLAQSSVAAQSVTPSIVNPVITNDLTVQLSDPLPTPVDLDSYTAVVRGPNSYQRQLRIVSYDASSKQLIVRFNGARSGNYKLVITDPNGEEITPNGSADPANNGLDL